MQNLNELKISINKLISYIDEENKLKRELEEKEDDYNNCSDEISKLEIEISDISRDIYNSMQRISENFSIFSTLSIMVGVLYTLSALLRKDSLASLIPITIGVSCSAICNVISNIIIKKKLNSVEYKNMQQKKEQKEIELENKKEKRNILAEEISKLKSQLNTNANTINESINTLNVGLEDDMQVTASYEEPKVQEKNKPKTRTLTQKK